MKWYLAKTDPETYSISDFEKEKVTTWNGVKAPQAVIFLKQMRKGDRILIYHSQGKCTIVGEAEVVGNSRPDPNEPRSWLVDFKFVKKYTPPFVTLQEIRKTGKFSTFRLVRQSRLSTMDVPEEFMQWFAKKVQLA